MSQNLRDASRHIAVWLIVALSLMACGVPQDEGDGPTLGDQSHGGEAVNWDNPLSNASSVPSLAAAASLLAFSPIAPNTMSDPITIWISNTTEPDQSLRQLALVYDDPEYSRFLVIEELSQGTQAELESLAGCDPSSGCQGSWTLTSIGDELKALVIAGPASNGAVWIDNGVRFDVFGQPETFSPDDAVAIATEMASRASST